MSKTTHFGYETVSSTDKTRRVGEVFVQLAPRFLIFSEYCKRVESAMAAVTRCQTVYPTFAQFIAHLQSVPASPASAAAGTSPKRPASIDPRPRARSRRSRADSKKHRGAARRREMCFPAAQIVPMLLLRPWLPSTLDALIRRITLSEQGRRPPP